MYKRHPIHTRCTKYQCTMCRDCVKGDEPTQVQSTLRGAGGKPYSAWPGMSPSVCIWCASDRTAVCVGMAQLHVRTHIVCVNVRLCAQWNSGLTQTLSPRQIFSYSTNKDFPAERGHFSNQCVRACVCQCVHCMYGWMGGCASVHGVCWCVWVGLHTPNV